jgi:hypothetical protein
MLGISPSNILPDRSQRDDPWEARPKSETILAWIRSLQFNHFPNYNLFARHDPDDVDPGSQLIKL